MEQNWTCICFSSTHSTKQIFAENFSSWHRAFQENQKNNSIFIEYKVKKPVGHVDDGGDIVVQETITQIAQDHCNSKTTNSIACKQWKCPLPRRRIVIPKKKPIYQYMALCVSVSLKGWGGVCWGGSKYVDA